MSMTMSMSRKPWFLLVLFSLAGLPTATGASPADVAQKVPQWGRFEAALQARSTHQNPLHDVTVDVTFTAPSGKTHRTWAFWDGAETWKVRFSPDEVGSWTFRTSAPGPGAKEDRGLHGQSGAFTCVKYAGRNPLLRRGSLRLSPDRRHFVHADGTPFFWMGDTAWNGPLKADAQSWKVYLADRAKKGFSAIQFVTHQWRAATGNADARPAFRGNEKITIVPEFWKWLDKRVDAINDQGLVASPVMLWAFTGANTADLNPGAFLPESQAIAFARYQLARYGAHHVVWLLGGDGDYRKEKAQRWVKIGRGVFGNEMPRQLVTMHPIGCNWVVDEFRNEPWYTFNGYQSGHRQDEHRLRWITEGPVSLHWNKQPALPHINLEPNYEKHRVMGSTDPRELISDHLVRRAAYWSLLAAPPAGISYGGQGIWSWELDWRAPMDHESTGIARPWNKSLDLPGAINMKHLRRLFDRLPWWELRPDPDLLAEQPGKATATSFVSAARAESGRWAMFYSPTGDPLKARLDRLAGPVSATWFDPATGVSRPAGRFPNAGSREIVPPVQGRDWVLVLR